MGANHTVETKHLELVAFPAQFLTSSGMLFTVHQIISLTRISSTAGLAASNPGLYKLVYGSFGLPVGLVLVMTMGAELFTGNVACLTAAMVEVGLTRQLALAAGLWSWYRLMCLVVSN